MSSNFHFTQVSCPVAKASPSLTSTHTPRSYLDDCHWFPTRQHSIRCMVVFWLISCPSSISSSWPQAADCQRVNGSARILTQAADAQNDIGSLQSSSMAPFQAIWCFKSRCQSHITPTCLQDDLLHSPLHPHTSQIKHLRSLSLAVSYLLPRTKPVDHENINIINMLQRFRVMIEKLVDNEYCLEWLLCPFLYLIKRNVGGSAARQSTSHRFVSLLGTLLKRNRCAATMFIWIFSSILPLSISVVLKEISQSKQHVKLPFWLMTFQWTLAL